MLAEAPTLFRMCISHTSPDTTVQQVLDKVNNECLVVDALGGDGVQGVIEGWSRRARSWDSFSLDLIAHSRRGVLHVGDWSVDGNGKSKLLHQACVEQLKTLNLREIRLLGCNTAVTRGGQDAILALAQVFGVLVKGTRVPISAGDFGADGFRAGAVLSDHTRLPRLAPLTLLSAGEWLGRFQSVAGHTAESIMTKLRRESLSDAIRDWSRTRPQLRWPVRQFSRGELDDLLSHVEPELAHAPGLLALPDLEIVVPVEGDFGAPRYHRFTVLLDGLWIRIYPRDQPEGIVLRTHGGELIQEVLGKGIELLRS